MVYRVDYVTECGTRGTWHDELEDVTYDEVIAQCRREFAHIDEQLKRSTDKRLKHLVIVEIVERDVGMITGGGP